MRRSAASELAGWLHDAFGQTHAIPAERLYELAHRWLVEKGTDPCDATTTLATDYRRSDARGRLAFGEVRVLAPALRGRRRVMEWVGPHEEAVSMAAQLHGLIIVKDLEMVRL